MAFPSTISTLVQPWNGLGGPYVSSGGNTYVVARSSTENALHIFKASDPSTSWAGAGVDVVMTSGNPILQFASCVFNNIIYVVTRDAASASTNVIRFHAFDMGTDTWTTSNTLVKNTYTIKGPLDESIVRIIVRSLTSIIIMYEGPQVLADVQRSRTYYARYMGAAWSADIALDSSGNVDWLPQEMVQGADGRVHFFVLDHTNHDLYQRCLTSANSLETMPAAFDSDVLDLADCGIQHAIAYSASASGTVVRYAYYDTFVPELADVRFTSADVPSPMTVTTDITGVVNPVSDAFRCIISLAADDNTVYATFTNTGRDLYIMSSQDAGSWSTPSLFLTAQANYIWTNIYTRNSARVMGILYQDSDAAVNYTEYTLSAAAVGGSILPRMGLLGIGR
jgi:hypothetical protein